MFRNRTDSPDASLSHRSATGFAPGSHGVGSSPWTLIRTDANIMLPSGRNAGPTTATFANTTAYTSYLVVFPAVKNIPATSLTQIAEVAFAYVPPITAPLRSNSRPRGGAISRALIRLLSDSVA